MEYNKEEVLQLLDAETITALLKIYNLKYKHIAGVLNVSRPAVNYMIQHDSFKPWQREKVLELLTENGMDNTQLVIISTMIQKQKRVKQ